MGWRRQYGNPDQNQEAIVELVRGLPASVTVTTGVGDGWPDIVVGFNGLTLPSEIKNEKGELRDSQKKFMREWRGGPILVARTGIELVQQIINIDKRTPPVRGVVTGGAAEIIKLCLKEADGLVVDEHDLPVLIRKLRRGATT